MTFVAELDPEVASLPEGWHEVVLSDVAKVNPETLRASTPADFNFGYIDISQIDGPGRCAGWTQQNFGNAPSRARRKVRAGDILVSTVRPYLRSFAQVPDADLPLVASTGFAVIRTGKEADQQFLYQHILHSSFIDHLTPRMTGSNYPAVSASDIEAYRFLLPPLDEQRRIAEVLRSVDEAIAATAALLNGVKATKQGTMEAVLSNGFTEVRLETLLAETRYPMRSGPFGSALLKSELQPEGIPLLGIDNVQVERFVPIYRRFISEEKYRELGRYTVYPGDVMVTIMGTVGRCCVVPPDVGTAISSKHVWTLTIDQERYSPALLAWQINHSPRVLAQLQGSAQGGIMSAISSGTLRDLLVPMPSPAQAREIEDLLLSFNTQIDALEAELDEATLLKAALMSDLLSGRVRVPA